MHPAASCDYRMGVDGLVQAVNQRVFPGGGECANTRTEVQQDESLPQLNTVTTLLGGSKADGLKQAGFGLCMLNESMPELQIRSADSFGYINITV